LGIGDSDLIEVLQVSQERRENSPRSRALCGGDIRELRLA
jgi:hypothetical protein